MFSLPWSRRICSCVALALATSLAAGHVVSPAFAQPEQEDLSRARAKFQQATELEQGGNWAGALQLFREVGQVRMTPQVRYHIALCEANLGKLVAALGGYELALADADTVGPGFRAEVEAGIESLRGRIPQLVIERGPGAEAATIELDGISLGASSVGVSVPIDPGPHSLRASAPGYEPYSNTVEAVEGEQQTVTVELEAIPEIAQTADEDKAVVQPKQKTPDGLVLNRQFWTYAAFGAGGVFLLGGGAAFLMREQKLQDIEQLCGSSCDGKPEDVFNEASAARDSARTYRIVGFVSIGLGLAGAGVGTYLLLTDKRDKTAWLLTPDAPGADLAGLSFSTAF